MHMHINHEYGSGYQSGSNAFELKLSLKGFMQSIKENFSVHPNTK